MQNFLEYIQDFLPIKKSLKNQEIKYTLMGEVMGRN